MAETKEPIKLTVSQLQADLKAGMNRKEQAKKYGIPLAALNRLYKANEHLKGKRVFTPRGSKLTQVELIDDTPVDAKPDVKEGGEATINAGDQTSQVETGSVDAGTSTNQPEAQPQVETAKTAW